MMGRERKEVEDGRKNVNMMSLMSVRVKDNLFFLKKSVCAQLFFSLNITPVAHCLLRKRCNQCLMWRARSNWETDMCAGHDTKARVLVTATADKGSQLFCGEIFFLLLTMPCVFFISINQLNYMHTWSKKASQSNAATVAQARTRQ